ncbi:MAG TPA: sigma-54 dependent transcriptional regulator [Thermomicrobiales bacterium]|nr:sigma-54 dependent transcriptional regulator [Thermomicrobiales bacterium]
MPRILIADDEEAIRSLLREFLSGEGFEVSEATNGQQVQDALTARTADLVLMDVRMPDKTGIDVLREVQEGQAVLPVIVMTAYSTANLAIEATQLGAYEYISKPFDLDHVLVTINNFFKHRELADQVEALQARLTEGEPGERIVGNTPAMQEVYKTIGRVARSDISVLITGETGTGKESVATAIHKNSTYSRGPLIKVNCAALPETLLESELFGHEKGSFTGAIAQHKGRFEQANKGSIFLDEVGEMTLATQRKLLRVLQEKEFERVGGTITVKVDTRVIAATNKDLVQEVAEKRFRDDLYYRLSVITIHLPPLRDRKEDIPLLTEHFLNKHRYGPGSPPARITEGAMQLLLEHDWPGNVRELENTINRATVLTQGGLITEDAIVFSTSVERRLIDIGQRVREGQSLDAILAETERTVLSEALNQYGGDRVRAAQALSLTLDDLLRKLRDYGLVDGAVAVP